jgi:hypothetical protein
MMLKQPLITMSNESLEGEGQQTKLQKERQSRSVICKSFLLGSYFGFALQAMSYAAYYTLFKMFGKDTKAGPGSLLSSFSYCMLVLTSQLVLAIFIALLLTVVYTTTKSGSLYMRKKFDKDAANPNPGSIWTTQMVGFYFLFGTTIGSVSLRAGVALHRGMVVPWMPLFGSLMVDFVAFIFMVKWFDWSHPLEQELGDDHSSIV